MKKIFLFIFLILIVSVVSGCGISGNAVKEDNKIKATVFKDLSCGCCGNYVSYLEKNGFDVDVVNSVNMFSIKDRYGVPSNMESCHTTEIGDYFVEGHVPIEAINKLLGEKPSILGISLPDMPSASPGMPGRKSGPFSIYAISANGQESLFMTI